MSLSAIAFVLGTRPTGGVSPATHAAEVDARAAADAALADDIAAEATARAAADAALADDIAAEVDARAAADTALADDIAAEADARAAVDAALANAIFAEADARAAAVSALMVGVAACALQVDLAAEVSARQTAVAAVAASVELLGRRVGASAIRPGEQTAAFGAGTVGSPDSLPEFGDGVSSEVIADLGQSLVVTDQLLTIAPRLALAVHPGRIYRLHVVLRRLSGPADPAGDTAQIGLRRLGAAHDDLGLTILDDRTLSVGNQVRRYSATFMVAPALSGVDAALTVQTVYVRPYVHLFGADHRTAVAQIEVIDVTEAAQIEGVLGALSSAQAAAAAASVSAALAATSAANAALSAAAASTSADAAAASAAQAHIAAIAAGAPIVTALTMPVPADGTIELLVDGSLLQVWQVVSGAWAWQATLGREGAVAGKAVRLADELHPTDRAAIVSGDITGLDPTRVTAACRAFVDKVIDALFEYDGAQVFADVMPGQYGINDRLMSDYFNDRLWSTSGYGRSRVWFTCQSAVTWRLRGWVPGRAALRSDGIYDDSEYIAPIAVWEWIQPTGSQRLGGMFGQYIVEGANDIEGDPIGFYFYRLNATHLVANIETRNLRNRSVVFDSVFNSRADYVRSAASGGLSLTECGGTGLIQQDTTAGGVTTGLRYTVSGTTLTVSKMVFDASIPAYNFEPVEVFSPDHVGKWISLERQGRVNLLGDDPDGGTEGGSSRRSARWFQIVGYTDPATVSLAVAPPYQGDTGQTLPNLRRFSFGVLKVSILAGSHTATLSMPVSTNLEGLEVIIPGAYLQGGADHFPNLVAMVTDHDGAATITLSHAARFDKSDVPLVLAPQVHFGNMSHTALLPSSRKCDDVHIGRLWCESANAPALPLFVQRCTNVTLGDESKLHGCPLNNNNYGANFTCVLAGDVGGRWAGRYTHSRHSREFGMFYLTGDRCELKIDGELSSWTASDQSSIFYLDPGNVATTRVWDVFVNVSDYATGYPDPSAGQVFERGGANYTYGRIKSGASQRGPRGEVPLWPLTVLPPVDAPAIGTSRARAVSASARGGWVPTPGMVYQIGGLNYLGRAGSTEVADLPGLDLAATPSMRAVYGGTANAITLSTRLGLSGTPPAGLELRFRAGTANSGATTIAVDGGTPQPCVTVTGVALPSGYIRTGVDAVARWDGTNWVLSREAQRIENANGVATRWADGRQVCHVTGVDWGDSAAAGTGALNDPYRTVTGVWTFPAAFSGPPAVTGMVRGDSNGVSRHHALSIRNVNNSGISQAQAIRLAQVNTALTPLIDLTATGVWY